MVRALAARMIGRFLDAGHGVDWVAGDEVYGGNPNTESWRTLTPSTELVGRCRQRSAIDLIKMRPDLKALA
ncbi:hypothetical protein FNH09_23810 [Streptomyces adustus]|uniref:Uncharacterized protein n=1 Tax=Streptomyces adustus TaxID=1609272 RepID=A0A5N8VJ91_9ACTN|nr:hypothetical protein [Streptomyces adustus]